MRTITCLAAAVLALPAAAEEMRGWSCSNPDMEISCDAEACEAITDGFTPMGVTWGPDGFSVCAYSGCWEGVPLVVENDAMLYLQGRAMRWSHAPEDTPDDGSADFQVAIDKAAGLGVMVGGGYAHPMHCTPRS